MLRLRKRNNRRNESGFFTIWVMGLVVVVFFIGGISLDLWKTFTARQDLSEIADGASVAGASKVDLQAFQQDSSSVELKTDPDPIDSETAISRANDYIDNAIAQDNVTLTARDVEIVNGQLQVTLEEKSDTTLTRILVPTKSFTVHVVSTAQPRLVAQ